MYRYPVGQKLILLDVIHVKSPKIYDCIIGIGIAKSRNIAMP